MRETTSYGMIICSIYSVLPSTEYLCLQLRRMPWPLALMHFFQLSDVDDDMYSRSVLRERGEVAGQCGGC